MKITKELKKVDTCDTTAIQNWINKQDKSYLESMEDLLYHFNQFRRMKISSMSWASMITSAIYILATLLTIKLGGNQSSLPVLNIVVPLLLIWGLLAPAIYFIRLNPHIRSTCSKFLREWKRLKELRTAGRSSEFGLREYAAEVARLQRLEDSSAKAMRKRFIADHAIVFAFGQCRNDRFGSYFSDGEDVAKVTLRQIA